MSFPLLLSRYKNLEGKVSRITLPQYLLNAQGTQYEDFENAADWTANNGSVANNSTAGQFKTGTQSVKLTANAAATAFITKTVNWDLSGNWGRANLQYYQHNVAANYNGSFHIQFSNDATFTNYFRCWIANGKMTTIGWNNLAFAKSSFAAVNAASWANPIIRVRLQFVSAAAQTPAISFDNLTLGAQGIPAILMSFDDGTTEQYTNCFPYMRQYQIPGTLWAQTDGINGAGYMTNAQLSELDAAGWTVGNHTNSASNLGGQAEAAQEAQILGGKTALQSWGLSKGVNYVDYPSGSWDENTVTAMTNLGMLAGRTVIATIQIVPADQQLGLPWENMYMIPSGSVTTQSLATVQGYVDNAINYGEILTLHFHKVGTAGQMSTANFQLLIDYIRTKAKSGLIYPITIHDLYQLTQNSVSIPQVI